MNRINSRFFARIVFTALLLWSFKVMLMPNLVVGQKVMRIYLWDTTKSMQTNGVWESTKGHLLDQLEAVNDPDLEVVLITFTKKVQKVMVGQGNNLAEMIQFVRTKSSCDPGNTNICGALEEAKSYCHAQRVESIILFTDGEQNYPNKTCLGPLLDDWCAFFADKYNSNMLYHKLKGSLPPAVTRNQCIQIGTGADVPTIIQLHRNKLEYSVDSWFGLGELDLPITQNCSKACPVQAAFTGCGGQRVDLVASVQGGNLVINLAGLERSMLSCVRPGGSATFTLDVFSADEMVKILSAPVRVNLIQAQTVDVLIKQVHDGR